MYFRVVALFLINFTVALGIALAIDGDGGFLNDYSQLPVHLFVAKSLSMGATHFPISLDYGMQMDMQFYNGTYFTNWGYGFPIILLTFGTIWGWLSGQFGFVMVPETSALWILAASVATVFALVLGMPTGRGKLWGYAHPILVFWCLFVVAVLDIMSHRFLQYEQNIAVMMLFAMVAAAVLIKGLGQPLKRWELLALGVAFGFGLMTRPTIAAIGLPFFAVLVYRWWRTGRLRDWQLVAAGCLPFVLAFFAFNYLRSGSLVSFGFHNAVTGIGIELPKLRFGSTCHDSWESSLSVLKMVVQSLFVDTRDMSVFNLDCQFVVERNKIYDHAFTNRGTQALFLISALASIWARPLRVLVGAAAVAVATLVAAYVWAGSSIIFRYAGDFHVPLIIPAMSLLLFHRGELKLGKYSQYIVVTLLLSTAALYGYHAKQQYDQSVHTGNLDGLHRYGNDPNFRWFSTVAIDEVWETETEEASLPSEYTCTGRPPNTKIAGQFAGWNAGCSVNSYTNMFLGFPFSPSGKYLLYAEIEPSSQAEFRITINGDSHRLVANDTSLQTSFDLDYERFHQKVVQVSIQWKRGYGDPGIKLNRIGIAPLW